MRILLIIFLFFVTQFSLFSQEEAPQNLYIHQKDGNVKSFAVDDILSVSHSEYDEEGIKHDSEVSQEIKTRNQTFLVPLSSIDFINFGSEQSIYQKNVIFLSEKWQPYIISAEDEYLQLTPDFPEEWLPDRGDVIFAEYPRPPYENGFAGIVNFIYETKEGYEIACTPAMPTDIYESFSMSGEISSDETVFPRAAGNIDIDLPSDFQVDLPGGITLYVNPHYTLQYDIRVKGKSSYAKVILNHTYDCSVKLDLDKESDWEPEPVYAMKGQVRIPQVPGLFIGMDLGGFAKLRGSAHLDITQPFTVKGTTGFEMGEGAESKRYDSWQIERQDLEATLDLFGEFKTGFSMSLNMGYISKKVANMAIEANLGCKLTGWISLKEDLLKEKGAYRNLSRGNVMFSVIGEISSKVCLLNVDGDLLYDNPSFEIPVANLYVMPELENLEWIKGEDEVSGLAHADIKRDLLLPVKVGWEVYDPYNKRTVALSMIDEPYWRNENWVYNGLERSFTNLPNGSELHLYPVVEIMGIKLRADDYVYAVTNQKELWLNVVDPEYVYIETELFMHCDIEIVGLDSHNFYQAYKAGDLYVMTREGFNGFTINSDGSRGKCITGRMHKIEEQDGRFFLKDVYIPFTIEHYSEEGLETGSAGPTHAQLGVHQYCYFDFYSENYVYWPGAEDYLQYEGKSLNILSSIRLNKRVPIYPEATISDVSLHVEKNKDSRYSFYEIKATVKLTDAINYFSTSSKPYNYMDQLSVTGEIMGYKVYKIRDGEYQYETSGVLDWLEKEEEFYYDPFWATCDKNGCAEMAHIIGHFQLYDGHIYSQSYTWSKEIKQVCSFFH